MYETFNTASLANLSRQELLALLADLQGRFNAASDAAERNAVHDKIAAVKLALQFK